MGFGGSVSAMLASLRQNKRERVSRFEKPNTHKSKNNISLKFKKLSEKELIKAKAEIKRKSQSHKRKTMLYTLIALIILAVLVYWLFLDSGRPLV